MATCMLQQIIKQLCTFKNNLLVCLLNEENKNKNNSKIFLKKFLL